ncbi:hypothetical protein NUW54_g3790 [Trametes sanguinea]|uniref:Uncharacterized protein n=1 Tax=Trametes sanguinea TaxID=158606 RepID=A0ACC1Q1M9_9APHY|nr:hypothetical protein NUW54_g3790 [Trametes sanguinea]
MSHKSSLSYGIEPLTSKNFHKWCVQMADIFSELLWEFVPGANKILTDTTDTAQAQEGCQGAPVTQLRVAKDLLVYTLKSVVELVAERPCCPSGLEFHPEVHKLVLHSSGHIVRSEDGVEFSPKEGHKQRRVARSSFKEIGLKPLQCLPFRKEIA